MVREARWENRGAGVYGTSAPSHVTKCPHSHNPYGHNRECACGWWPREYGSQTVPYYPESPYPEDLEEL